MRAVALTVSLTKFDVSLKVPGNQKFPCVSELP